MILNAENSVLLGRAIKRSRSLLAAEPDLARSTPSLEAFKRVIDCRTSIEIVRNAVETYAERPALGFRKRALAMDPISGKRLAKPLDSFETISYRELWHRIALLASGMKQKALAKGDMVTLVGFSTVDHLVAELACHYIAAVSVPLARNIGHEALRGIVTECKSNTLFCAIEQLPSTVRAIASCPSIRLVVAIDAIEGDDEHRELLEEARVVAEKTRSDLELVTIQDMEDLGSRSPRAPLEIPAEGSNPLLTLVYTSGSTGAPKGVMFRERSWHARWTMLPFQELTSLPMVSVVFLPQNHMGGRNAIANSMRVGGVACFTSQADMSTLFEDIRIVRPTYIHLVPRLSEMIYQHYQSELAKRGASAAEEITAEMRHNFLGNRMLLALTASAPTPPEVLAFVKHCFDIPVVNVFAGTEYGQLFIDGTMNRQNVREYKLVGVPGLGYHTTDKPYPRGELCVKTARGISSYFKNASATNALFDSEGFMQTGDIFEQRQDGQMVWIDRKNNVLKLAQGEFVNLWKLEATFSSGSRFIKQIYLQGDSHRSYLLAVVVPEMSEIAAGSRSSEALRAIVRNQIDRLANDHQLQPYEIPRDFVVETEPFSRQNGLLTSLDKPSRPNLARKYGPALATLHEQLDERLRLLADPSLHREHQTVASFVQHAIASILGLPSDSLNLTRSMRSFGGDSIAAMSLCMLIERTYGLALSVSHVLGSQTTVADIVAEIESKLTRAPGSVATFERIHGNDSHVVHARDLRIERFYDQLHGPSTLDRASDDVLLTGATGFLGRFLCLAFLERAAETGSNVYCLVRAKSDDEAHHRLTRAYGQGTPLQKRFDTLAKGRLHALAGDIERPHFAWTEPRYQQLAERIGTTVHAAAHVNHALAYPQLFEANVLGTAEVIRFCLTRSAKQLDYVSTNSVTFALLGNRPIALETDDTRTLGDEWPIHSARRANGYQLSKWAGEALARDFSETHGIPCNIFRSNLILPPLSFRGQINAGDFFTRLIYSLVHTGLRPASFYKRATATMPKPHLDGLPVDFIAQAIAAISLGQSSGYTRYHVSNTHWNDGVSLDSVADRLQARGYTLTQIPDHAQWFQHFRRSLEAMDPDQQAPSSLPIIAQWATPLATEKRQRIDASQFRARVQSLCPMGCRDIPLLDDAYLDACIGDIIDLGLIPNL